MTGRRCAGCSRPLRDAASLAAGLGPVCRRRLRPAAQQSLPIPATADPRRLRRRGLPVADLPDLSTYQPEELPMADDRTPALDLPQLAVPCPRCSAPAGVLCTSHSGTRPRRTDTHTARRSAWERAGRPDATEASR